MYCPRSCFFLLTASLIATSLGSPKRSSSQCFQSVLWTELLQELEQLNKRGFSLECEEVSSEDLCFPEQMLKAVKYDNAAIVHIVHEIAEFFKRADIPFENKNTFLREMYEAHAQLKTCAPDLPTNLQESKPGHADVYPTPLCSRRAESFTGHWSEQEHKALTSKPTAPDQLNPRRNISHESTVKDCFKKMDEFVAKANDHCIWQEIHAHSREILQRIENYSFKRRATH
ncbi:hypothetical protein HGM15179_002276 [Zosterops borbonicus]|uniref:Uncharacterized protein n=1 Tax=Zosterops borbonicus TaxID=364589 RepID=A0A8K1LT94_9PASS|nr:hypothetical protein HGM15179_002276 [Zosterops borbonicus]